MKSPEIQFLYECQPEKKRQLLSALKATGISISDEEKLMKFLSSDQPGVWQRELIRLAQFGRKEGIEFSCQHGALDRKAVVDAFLECGGFFVDAHDRFLINVHDIKGGKQ